MPWNVSVKESGATLLLRPQRQRSDQKDLLYDVGEEQSSTMPSSGVHRCGGYFFSSPPQMLRSTSTSCSSNPSFRLCPHLSILSLSLVMTHANTSASCWGLSTRSPLDSRYNKPQSHNSCAARSTMLPLIFTGASSAIRRNSFIGTENLLSLEDNMSSSPCNRSKLCGISFLIFGCARACSTSAAFNAPIPVPVFESTAITVLMFDRQLRDLISSISSDDKDPNVSSSANVVAKTIEAFGAQL